MFVGWFSNVSRVPFCFYVIQLADKKTTNFVFYLIFFICSTCIIIGNRHQTHIISTNDSEFQDIVKMKIAKSCVWRIEYQIVAFAFFDFGLSLSFSLLNAASHFA